MRARPAGAEPRLHTCHLGGRKELPFLAVVAHGNVPRKFFGSPGPLGVPRQLPGEPRGEGALRGVADGGAGRLLGDRGNDPGRALCLPFRDVAHAILHKAYRKVLDQLSRKKLLQKLVAQGVG